VQKIVDIISLNTKQLEEKTFFIMTYFQPFKIFPSSYMNSIYPAGRIKSISRRLKANYGRDLIEIIRKIIKNKAK